MSTYAIRTTNQGTYHITISDTGFLGLGTSWEVREPDLLVRRPFNLYITNAGFLGLDTRVEVRDLNNNCLGSLEFFHLKPSVVKGIGVVAAAAFGCLAWYYSKKFHYF